MPPVKPAPGPGFGGPWAGESAPRFAGMRLTGREVVRAREESARRAAPKSGLAGIQQWMQEVLMHPRGVRHGLRAPEARKLYDVDARSLDRVILPSRALTSEQRLSIYANMYIWRLADIMAEEYPSVHALAGPKRFYRLAVSYLDRHPSRSWNLNRLSAKFPRFLREEARVSRRELLADVALVERTMEEVFDSPCGTRLRPQDIADVPREQWGESRFTLDPSVRLLTLSYPVDDVIAAVRTDRAPKVPRRADSWMIVYRRDFRVWRAPLTRERFTLLSSLARGKRLIQAFSRCASLPGFDAEAFMADLPGFFRRWASEGIFVGIDAGNPAKRAPR